MVGMLYYTQWFPSIDHGDNGSKGNDSIPIEEAGKASVIGCVASVGMILVQIYDQVLVHTTMNCYVM